LYPESYFDHFLISEFQDEKIVKNKSLFNRFNELLFERSISKDFNNEVCPFESCKAIICLPKNELSVEIQCPECESYFCRACRKAGHGSLNCEDVMSRPQMLKFLINKALEDSKSSTGAIDGEDLDKILTKIENLKIPGVDAYNKMMQAFQRENLEWKLETSSMQAIKEITTKCPECFTPIERNGGCLHMICLICGCDFWFNTGERAYF